MAIIIKEKEITVEVEAPTQVHTVSIAALHSMNMSNNRGVNSGGE